MWTLKMHSLRFGRRSLFLPVEKSCQHHYICVCAMHRTPHVKVRAACLINSCGSYSDQCQAASSWGGMWVEMAWCPKGKREAFLKTCLFGFIMRSSTCWRSLSINVFKFPTIRRHIIWICKHRESQDPDRIIDRKEINLLKLPWDSFFYLKG